MNRRIIDIDVYELKHIMQEVTQPLLKRIDELEKTMNNDIIKGYSGLAEYYQSSLSTIHRAKDRGLFRKAMMQVGPRTFAFKISELPKTL